MNILLIGSGGRESSISESFLKDKNTKIYIIMEYKNPYLINISDDFLICSELNYQKVYSFIKKNNIDLVFISSEKTLNTNIVDNLLKDNINVIGPSSNCSKIELDKGWMRELLDKYSINCNPKYKIFKYNDSNAIEHINDYIDKVRDVAIKPVGITSGKGVKVTEVHLFSTIESKQYAINLIHDQSIVIEEKIVGEEFSLHAFVDGIHLSFCPLVQDHKNLYNDDQGLNTGGMGSYTDNNHLLPFLNDSNLIDKAKKIMIDTVNAIFLETGTYYKGILYGQFILTKSREIKLIEYNARFGDPEAINILSILKTNLIDICNSIINTTLNKIKIEFENKSTVCKYLVPIGYPSNPLIGYKIKILNNNITNVNIYYANVNEINGSIYTTSSRSIAILSVDDSIELAEKNVEHFINHYVRGKLYHRTDIGTKESIQKKINKYNK